MLFNIAVGWGRSGRGRGGGTSQFGVQEMLQQKDFSSSFMRLSARSNNIPRFVASSEVAPLRQAWHFLVWQECVCLSLCGIKQLIELLQPTN